MVLLNLGMSQFIPSGQTESRIRNMQFPLLLNVDLRTEREFLSTEQRNLKTINDALGIAEKLLLNPGREMYNMHPILYGLGLLRLTGYDKASFHFMAYSGGDKMDDNLEIDSAGSFYIKDEEGVKIHGGLETLTELGWKKYAPTMSQLVQFSDELGDDGHFLNAENLTKSTLTQRRIGPDFQRLLEAEDELRISRTGFIDYMTETSKRLHIYRKKGLI